MRKAWPIFITVLIIPLLILSGILCCCFADQAQADEPQPSCHAGATAQPEHGSSSPDEECDCQSTSAVVPQPAVPTHDFISTLEEPRSPILLGFSYASASSVPTSVSYLAPPLTAVDSVPIYLQNSSLRL